MDDLLDLGAGIPPLAIVLAFMIPLAITVYWYGNRRFGQQLLLHADCLEALVHGDLQPDALAWCVAGDARPQEQAIRSWIAAGHGLREQRTVDADCACRRCGCSGLLGVFAITAGG